MFEDFLKDVAVAYRQQKAYKEECYKNGDYFNIFSILGLSSNETRTHSAFLAELLDPNGSHGKGKLFLENFISSMHLEDLHLDLNHVFIEVERVIGEIDETYDKGGRIDIIIVSGEKAIIIENKIYAQDQYKQLVRYNNYAKETFSDYRLLYLSLDKEEASPASTQSGNVKLMPNVDYYPITYRDDIIRWLEQCNSDIRPCCGDIVEKTVTQYINLLKELTNTMEKDNEDIMNVLKKEENWAYTLEVLRNGDSWKNEVWSSFAQLLEKEISAKGWLMHDCGLCNIKVFSHHVLSKYFIHLECNSSGAYIGIHCREEQTPHDCLPSLYGADAWWPYGWKWLEGQYKFFLPQSDPNAMEHLFPEYRQTFIDYLVREISTIMNEALKAGIDI